MCTLVINHAQICRQIGAKTHHVCAIFNFENICHEKKTTKNAFVTKASFGQVLLCKLCHLAWAKPSMAVTSTTLQ